jgi:hypothetical protein
MLECMTELKLATKIGFKSKHDDFIDTISMLGSLTAWKPSQVTPTPAEEDKYWGDWDREPVPNKLEQYLV